MTRRKLLLEGHDTEDGRCVAPRALRWDPMIPVRTRDGFTIGTVTDVKRDADGWLTGEVEFYLSDETAPISLCAELKTVELADDDDTYTVTDGVIAGFLFLYGAGHSAWPKAGEVVTDA